MLNYEIIIAGAGPSGAAAALQLTKLDPGLAGRILLIDKAVFPRPKLCAGGVTVDAELVLGQLGVALNLPSVPIHTSKFVLPTGSLSVHRPNHIRIFRREDFDHNLFQHVRARGVVIREGEAVEHIIHTPAEVIVRTSKNEYRGKILIGADGANSVVRKFLDLSRSERLMMALEIFAPAEQVKIPDLADNTTVLDFSLTSGGFPGYCWVFPAVPQGPPMFSLGIMEAPFGKADAVSLKTAFACWLRELGIDLEQFNLRGHPALRYEPRARCSKPRVLLVGDAAGVDPLLGEGITSALALGTIAAQVALDAIRRGNFSFADYEKRIRASSVGTLMRRRRLLARRLYTDPTFGRRYLKYAGLLKWVALFDPQRRFGTMTWEPAAA
jgi:geranylgeranyl reductase family protein